VLVRQDSRGGLRRMRLVDFQTLEPDADLLPGLLQGVLQRCARESFDVLEHLGWGLPKMCRLDQFAPYRGRLPNWTYYYRAVDPDLEAHLSRPESWDPSTYDGDASLT
jgi:hypothetical protein